MGAPRSKPRAPLPHRALQACCTLMPIRQPALCLVAFSQLVCCMWPCWPRGMALRDRPRWMPRGCLNGFFGSLYVAPAALTLVYLALAYSLLTAYCTKAAEVGAPGWRCGRMCWRAGRLLPAACAACVGCSRGHLMHGAACNWCPHLGQVLGCLRADHERSIQSMTVCSGSTALLPSAGAQLLCGRALCMTSQSFP